MHVPLWQIFPTIRLVFVFDVSHWLSRRSKLVKQVYRSSGMFAMHIALLLYWLRALHLKGIQPKVDKPQDYTHTTAIPLYDMIVLRQYIWACDLYWTSSGTTPTDPQETRLGQDTAQFGITSTFLTVTVLCICPTWHCFFFLYLGLKIPEITLHISCWLHIHSKHNLNVSNTQTHHLYSITRLKKHPHDYNRGREWKRQSERGKGNLKMAPDSRVGS